MAYTSVECGHFLLGHVAECKGLRNAEKFKRFQQLQSFIFTFNESNAWKRRCEGLDATAGLFCSSYDGAQEIVVKVRDRSVPGSYQPGNAALFVGQPTAHGIVPC